MLKKLLALPILVIFIIGGAMVVRNFNAQNNVVITFSDSKHLTIHSNAYFAGTVVGMVIAVEPTTDKKIAVTVDLKRNIYQQVNSKTGFFIDTDPLYPQMHCLLIELSHQAGEPVSEKVPFQGIDSAFAWAAFKTANFISDKIESQPEPKDNADLAQAWVDIRKAFSEIDTEKMAERLRDETEQLQTDFDHLMKSEKVQKIFVEIDKKLDQLQKAAAAEASNSPEVQHLKKSLADLFRKLKHKTPKSNDIEA